MRQRDIETSDKVFQTTNSAGSSSVVLVCEHASSYIPAFLDGLGLSEEARVSHVAWDPGALGVAEYLSERLDAVLFASRVSRLVYDCNRPPDAQDAMPARSEVFDIPGNLDLSASARNARANEFYWPFHDGLQDIVARHPRPVLITIHSFTPIYHGKMRSVEIGVLHDGDTRLANAMLQVADAHTRANVQRNEPYGPEHGVTHTLKEHALKHGHLNVMLELRNDLIKTKEQQSSMADMIANWVADSFSQLKVPGMVKCQA